MEGAVHGGGAAPWQEPAKVDGLRNPSAAALWVWGAQASQGVLKSSVRQRLCVSFGHVRARPEEPSPNPPDRGNKAESA